LQFLAWVADRPRTYGETMDAWRSTCPQLSVWEDAILAGLVQIENGNSRAVTLTRRGRALLGQQRERTQQGEHHVTIKAGGPLAQRGHCGDRFSGRHAGTRGGE
jgi:hypothetical protein